MVSRAPFKIRGAEILATDTPHEYRRKLARIAQEEAYQFVALLGVTGTLLEVNRVAVEDAGLKLADFDGKPFWECYWWTISKQAQNALEQAVSRAAQGEFVRYDAEICGRANSKETVLIDFSLIPIKNALGEIVFLAAEGRNTSGNKTAEREISRKNADPQFLLERFRELEFLEEGTKDSGTKPARKKELPLWIRNLMGLKNSPEHYGSLFKSVDVGFCTIKVLFDKKNKPLDYQFLEVNGAFEKQTGLKHAVGKRMRELAPEIGRAHV